MSQTMLSSICVSFVTVTSIKLKVMHTKTAGRLTRTVLPNI